MVVNTDCTCTVEDSYLGGKPKNRKQIPAAGPPPGPSSGEKQRPKPTYPFNPPVNPPKAKTMASSKGVRHGSFNRTPARQSQACSRARGRVFRVPEYPYLYKTGGVRKGGPVAGMCTWCGIPICKAGAATGYVSDRLILRELILHWGWVRSWV